MFRIWNDTPHRSSILCWDTTQQSFHYPIIIPNQPQERRELLRQISTPLMPPSPVRETDQPRIRRFKPNHASPPQRNVLSQRLSLTLPRAFRKTVRSRFVPDENSRAPPVLAGFSFPHLSTRQLAVSLLYPDLETDCLPDTVEPWARLEQDVDGTSADNGYGHNHPHFQRQQRGRSHERASARQ